MDHEHLDMSTQSGPEAWGSLTILKVYAEVGDYFVRTPCTAPSWLNEWLHRRQMTAPAIQVYLGLAPELPVCGCESEKDAP